MYKVIARWRDLSDGHLYEVGDKFPHDGRRISGERISELTSGRNAASRALIVKTEDPKSAADAKEAPAVTEQPPKPRKARKKA